MESISQGLANRLVINRIRETLALSSGDLYRTIRAHSRDNGFGMPSRRDFREHRYDIVLDYAQSVVKEIEPEALIMPHNMLFTGEFADGVYQIPVQVDGRTILVGGTIKVGTVKTGLVKGRATDAVLATNENGTVTHLFADLGFVKDGKHIDCPLICSAV